MRVWGDTVNNGWTITAWGFWRYKTSSGIGTKFYIAASTTPLAEGDFSKFSTGFSPFTSYMVQARCYYERLTDPPAYEGEKEYVEVFGDWIEYITHAYCYPDLQWACKINKTTGNLDLYGDVADNDGGNCVERGFEIGETRTATWVVKETGNFNEMYYKINTTLPIGKDYFMRAYCKSASGHVRYWGMVEPEDSWDGGWRKFSTKDLSKCFCTGTGAWYYDTGSISFVAVYNEQGKQVDCHAIANYDIWPLTVDNQEGGHAYYGCVYTPTSSNRIKFTRLSDGASMEALATGIVSGIFAGNDNYIYSLENKKYVYRRNKFFLESQGFLTLTGTKYYGLALDEEGYIYVINCTTYGQHKIEKWSFWNTHLVEGVTLHSFLIEGDFISELEPATTIEISGSTGNNGTYTITVLELEEGDTRITISEELPSEIVDGSLIRSGSGIKQAEKLTLGIAMTYGNIAIAGETV